MRIVEYKKQCFMIFSSRIPNTEETIQFDQVSCDPFTWVMLSTIYIQNINPI